MPHAGILVFVLLAFAVVLAVVLGFVTLFWRNRASFSRFIDRFDIKPSQLHGVLQISAVIPAILLVIGLPLAAWTMLVFYVVTAGCLVATGTERLLRPPEIERRPPWYVGDAHPEWSSNPPKTQRSFSLRWIGVFACTICMLLSVLGVRVRAERQENQSQELALQQVTELGGEVTGRAVSFAGRTDIGDDQLRDLLPRLNKTTELNLGSTSITNETLKAIGRMDGLKLLNLSGTAVGDKGLQYLAPNRKLSRLSLRKTHVTGRGFPYPHQPRGMSVDLSLCPVDKKGIEGLAKSPMFGFVFLMDTDLNDLVVESLAGIRCRHLDLRRTDLTKEGIKRLKKMIPTTQVLP